MDCSVIWNGTDITNQVIYYNRTQNICSGVGTFKVNIKRGLNIEIGHTIVLYEGGEKKGTYFIHTVSEDIPDSSITIEAQDGSKQLNDYFIAESYLIDYPTYTRTWIEKFLSEANISYSFNTNENGSPLSNNTALGMNNLYETLTYLLQSSGWYYYFNAENVCIIGQLDVDIHNYSLKITDSDILKIDTNTNDTMLRNRSVVWGNGNPETKSWVYSDLSVDTPWNYDQEDKRTVVLTNGYIKDNATAYSINRKLLDEFSQITYLKQIDIHGPRDISLGECVFVDSTYYTGVGIVTSISSTLGKDGFFTTVILDERCPRLIGYFSLGGYVYVGTKGAGVWRKPLKYSNVWENYSAGIVDLNIKDLSISNGIFACVTDSGHLYTRDIASSYWGKINPMPMKDVEDPEIVYSGLICTGCAVDKDTSHIYAVFTESKPYVLNGAISASGTPRSWLFDFPSRYYYTATPIQLSGEDGILDPDVTSWDVDSSGDSRYISAIGSTEQPLVLEGGPSYLGYQNGNNVDPVGTFNVVFPKRINNEQPYRYNYIRSNLSTKSNCKCLSNVILHDESAFPTSVETSKNYAIYVEIDEYNNVYLAKGIAYFDTETSRFNQEITNYIKIGTYQEYNYWIYEDILANKVYVVSRNEVYDSYNNWYLESFNYYIVNLNNNTYTKTQRNTYTTCKNKYFGNDFYGGETEFVMDSVFIGSRLYVLIQVFFNSFSGIYLASFDMTTGDGTTISLSTYNGSDKVLMARSISCNSSDAFVPILKFSYPKVEFIISTISGTSHTETTYSVYDPTEENIAYTDPGFTFFNCFLSGGKLSSDETYQMGSVEFKYVYQVGSGSYENHTFVIIGLKNSTLTYQVYNRKYVVNQSYNPFYDTFKEMDGPWRYDNNFGILNCGQFFPTISRYKEPYLITGGTSSDEPNKIILWNPFTATKVTEFSIYPLEYYNKYTFIDVVPRFDDSDDTILIRAGIDGGSIILLAIDSRSFTIKKRFETYNLFNLLPFSPRVFAVGRYLCCLQQSNTYLSGTVYTITGFIDPDNYILKRKVGAYGIIREKEKVFTWLGSTETLDSVESSKGYPTLAYGGNPLNNNGNIYFNVRITGSGENEFLWKMNLIPENYYVSDARYFNITSGSGISRCIGFCQDDPDDNSRLMIADLSLILTSGNPVFNSVIPQPWFTTFSGYVNHLETSNLGDYPYVFVSISGLPNHFYQKDSIDYLHNYPTTFIERSIGLPNKEITVIRLDDRL
jgi:hypothetical protein